MKNIFTLVGLFLLISFSTSTSVAQVNHQNNTSDLGNVEVSAYTGIGDFAESLWRKGEIQWRNSMIQTLNTNETSLDEFITFNETDWFKDRAKFFSDAIHGNISEESAKVFFKNLEKKYVAIWETEGNNRKDVKRSIISQPPSPQAACNPSCYNINFQNGTLSGWNAYHARAGSAGCTATINTPTGGACGAVTQAAGPDPNTGNSYHVQLMTTPGSDPIAGGFIPFAPPLGGISAMVGDGPSPAHGSGILEQTYMVDAASPILTLQYAVVLENPGHTCAEQPWFKIDVLDQNGTAIPGCGQYFVYATGGLPGFKAFYYPNGGDTVYCRAWSTAFVPLYNYIGQCVTLRVTSSDCAHGGHFGYGYVAATCSKLELTASSAVWCTGQTSATITGPPGAAAYQWSTANGCISGSSALQSITITCPGKYNLVTQSSAGVQCVDTFSLDIPSVPVGPPPVPCFTATRVCSGTPTQFDASCSTPSSGNKYYWDFYNTGHYDDSSGANPSFTFTSGGLYYVRLHIVTANGCGADTIIAIPVDSTNNYLHPTITPVVTNTTACGLCNGKVKLSVATSTAIRITTSFNGALINMSGTGSISASGCACSIAIGPGVSFTWSNLCPGVYSFYISPQNAIPPSNCNPGGFFGDTVQVVVGTTGVNITSNITSTSASCGQNNGSATLTGLGGTAPYSYSWKTPNLGNGDTKTGLAPGTYIVEVRDTNNCLGISKVVIANYAQIAAQVVPFNSTCFGSNDGKIKITPFAGIAPFTYSWTPNVSTVDSASGLAPGSYSILITDSTGCTGTVNATITQPTQVVATIIDSVTQVPCAQTGSATVAGTGGFGPYTYKWTNGATTPVVTNLTVGTHVVTITDAFGCTDSTQVTVVCGSIPKAIFVSSDTVFCNEGGSCIDFFDLSTGSPTGWQWTFPGAQPDTSTQQNPTTICYYTPGSYVVKLVITNASGMDSITINPLIIFASGASAPVITVSHDTLFSSHASVYQWYFNGLPIAGATDSFYVAKTPGEYNIYITDANECNRLGTALTWTSVDELNNLSQISIYPNPAGNQFTVYGLQFAVATKLELYNAIGENVYRNETIHGNPQTVVDVSSLANGIYSLRILSGDESITKKIIVVHK